MFYTFSPAKNNVDCSETKGRASRRNKSRKVVTGVLFESMALALAAVSSHR